MEQEGTGVERRVMENVTNCSAPLAKARVAANTSFLCFVLSYSKLYPRPGDPSLGKRAFEDSLVDTSVAKAIPRVEVYEFNLRWAEQERIDLVEVVAVLG